MPDHPRPRILVVGSGVAGSLLAWELLRLGAEVTLCHDADRPGSSGVAAGLITPITGLRFVKSWNLDRILPQARSTYGDLETLSKRSVFKAFNILRLFKNQDELGRWRRKADLTEMQEYLVQEWDQIPSTLGIRHETGGLEFRGGGWVDMGALLQILRDLIEKKTCIVPQTLDYADVELQSFTARWRGEDYDRIIFCQGYRPENPWFDWLDWKPAQGEILTLRIPGFPADRIINRGLFILPLGGDLFRCGATYNWNHLQCSPAPGGRSQLEAELLELISLPFEVVEHSAAVRPILKDTLPVLGLHPRHPALGIFNGLGSKGALTAPFYAKHLALHLVTGAALDSDVDIARNR